MALSIQKVAIGGWKDAIPDELHYFLNKNLEYHLKEWDYEV